MAVARLEKTVAVEGAIRVYEGRVSDFPSDQAVLVPGYKYSVILERHGSTPHIKGLAQFVPNLVERRAIAHCLWRYGYRGEVHWTRMRPDGPHEVIFDLEFLVKGRTAMIGVVCDATTWQEAQNAMVREVKERCAKAAANAQRADAAVEFRLAAAVSATDLHNTAEFLERMTFPHLPVAAG
jgi:hypothetical protein